MPDFENMSDEEFEQYANENPVPDEAIPDHIEGMVEEGNDPEDEDDVVVIDEPEVDLEFDEDTETDGFEERRR